MVTRVERGPLSLSEVSIEWEPRRLGELCSPRRELIEPSHDGLTRYVGLEHLDSGFARLRRWGTDADLRSTKAKFRQGDVLYGKLRPYLNKAARAEWEGVCSTDILVLRPKPEEVDPAFLSFLLHSPDFLAHAIATTSGVNHPRTDWNSVAVYEQPIPSPPEQRAIAGVLSTLQSAVELQHQIVATLKALKAATMAKLFREGLHGGPLKQTEIGEIPGSWELGSLEDVKAKEKGAIVAGPFGSNIGSRFFLPAGVPVIRGNNLTKGDSFFLDRGFVFVSEEKARELRSCEALPGDLIFTAAGTIGQVGLIPTDATYPAYVISNKQLRVRLDTTAADPTFLFYWFSSNRVQRLFAERRGGTSIPVINLRILRGIPIPLLPVTEQAELAATVARVDAVIYASLVRVRLLESLFRSTLNSLLTGRVRVVGSVAEEVTT